MKKAAQTSNKPEVEVLNPMTDEECARLEELESIVRNNFGAFVETGMALAEIRNRKLYRGGPYKTFEAYCKAIWEMNYRHANRLIASSGVVENILSNFKDDDLKMGPIGPILPINEFQVRPLTKLDPDMQVKAWRDVIQRSKETNKKPTAHTINRIAMQYRGEQIRQGYRETKERVSTETVVSPAFKKGFQAFLDVVSQERNLGWRQTSRKAAIRHVATIIKLIEQDD